MANQNSILLKMFSYHVASTDGHLIAIKLHKLVNYCVSN